MSEPVKWKDKGMSIKIDQQGINHVIQYQTLYNIHIKINSQVFSSQTASWTVSHNKNIDIKLSTHDTFLEKPSSDTLKIERLESQII